MTISLEEIQTLTDNKRNSCQLDPNLKWLMNLSFDVIHKVFRTKVIERIERKLTNRWQYTNNHMRSMFDCFSIVCLLDFSEDK